MNRTVTKLAIITSMILSASVANADDLIRVLKALQSNRVGNYDRGYRAYEVADYGRGSNFVAGHSYRNEVYPRSSREGDLRSSRLHAPERAEYHALLERIAELEELDRTRFGARSTARSFRDEPLSVPPRPTPPRRRSNAVHRVVSPTAVAQQVIVERAVPVAPPRGHYDFGDIVTCNVETYRRVRVSDSHDIARNAVPTVVAIKAPGACTHACTCCADEVVFVEVMAPPCEPRDVRVSPCGRRIFMDYGKYEVRVAAGPSSIKIDYDD